MKNRPIEEKESYKWIAASERSNIGFPIDIKTVTVCDREADLFEFFDRCFTNNHLFLVRATHNRKIDDEIKLFDCIRNANVSGEVVVEIPRDTRNNDQKRLTTLEISYEKVNIPVPVNKQKHLNKKDFLEVTIILAKEKNSLENKSPIEWFLITNCEIDSLE